MGRIVLLPIRVWLIALLVLIGTLSAPGFGVGAPGPERSYRIALIGDPHLPGTHLASKEALIRTVGGWVGIDRVIVLGDICDRAGTAAEYAFAKAFFAPLPQPLRFVVGNHDYFYEDEPNFRGRLVEAPPEVRRMKLVRFAETFGLKQLYSEERLGDYLLVYLSTDELHGSLLAQFSKEQMDWLEKALARNRTVPTLIFAHAPLAGTLHAYNEHVNAPSFVAQPAESLRELILANPQIVLWAAGHMHVPATNESYAAPVNRYEGRVMTIHNSNLGRKRSWTNVLDLYPGRVVVRTYDHGLKGWRPDLERTIPAPP
jgi:Icc protein